MNTPVVFQYQQALDEFRRVERASPLLKRMSELISLLDLTSTLASSLSNEEILDAALLIVMGELQASRGALLVRAEDGGARVRAGRGLPAQAPLELPAGILGDLAEWRAADGARAPVLEALGLTLLCPVFKGGRAIAWLGLGPRADGTDYGPEQSAFLRSVAACAATPIENGRIYHELKRLNQRLSLKVFQLHGLFDVSRELTAAADEASVTNLVTGTLMGQLMLTRCALYLLADEGLRPLHERGVGPADDFCLPHGEAAGLLASLRAPVPVLELPAGALRERLERQRLALLVPLSLGGSAGGFLALGARPSGAPFSDEDGDFATTLGRQALAALQSLRLHRVRVEKERQDRELQIAREIQQSLFPRLRPALPGCSVAAESRSCYQVGGDLFDFIQLPGERLGLTVADVSGKGTPASLLMASVHAWMQALAGTVDPPELLRRLSRFLFESTQANKFVTLFYAELDPLARRLRYVNAGHIPPYLVRREGALLRLDVGGPVLGLLPGVAFEAGDVQLQAEDVLAVVTDGATEAQSPDEEEFGDERLIELLRAARGANAEGVLGAIFAGVARWTGPAGCSDDLTALVVKVDA